MAETKKSPKMSKESLLKTVKAADRMFEKSDPKWFDFLAKDVVVYAINQTTPVIGRDAYKKKFGPSFRKSKRKLNILVRNVQLVGELGVVAQTVQVVQSQIVATVRQSVVWHQEKGVWVIKHLHAALVGTPVPQKMAPTAEGLSVLNEKIATVSAVLGLAQ